MHSMATEAGPGPADSRRATPRPGDDPLPTPRHTPGALVVTERRRADRWKNGAILICLAALLLAFLTVRAGRATEVIHVMDPLGNIYVGPLEPLADSKRFFNLTAIYATNAALQRSPAGFDLAELLKLYYSPRAVAKLQDDQKARESDIHRRNLQWKPIIESISEPVPAGGSRIVEIRGRLVMAGAFARRSFYDESPFTLVVTFMRNPDLGKAGAYPWVGQDIDLRITPAERKTK